jgi:tetratricopeptide (TPR) repeat protein
MTAQKELKSIIRARQNKTGESYSTARTHVMRTRAERLGLPEDSTTTDHTERVEAIVLRTNQSSARVRVLGDASQLTFRSSDAAEIVPGHIVTLLVKKRWQWRGDPYASGDIENPRIDVPKLGLVPLPLEEIERACDLRAGCEPFRMPDPYAPLWRKLTAKRRASYEMDPIAWGAFPDADIEDNPTCDAAELAEAGNVGAARELLMNVLLRDLRCIDAHAHLGNHEFDDSPSTAIMHYEIGIGIGELSLPPGFEGVLLWGHLHNRPFLRCLHGYGLCLWRLGRHLEAQTVFERILSLNPNDNQGVRSCLEDLHRGRSWEEAQEADQQEFTVN